MTTRDPDYYDIWEGSAVDIKNAGFVYENKIFSHMKKLGLTPPRFAPAGSSNELPDLAFLYIDPNALNANLSPVTYKAEIKLDVNADYGQSGLGYHNGKWVLQGKNTPEAKVMRDLLDGMGVPSIVNKVWGPKGAPRKFTAKETGRNMSPRDIEIDKRNFGDIYVTGSDAPRVSTLFRYYGTKNTHYIQIGGYGLYYMQSDPANLKKHGVKRFDGTLKLRIRRKPGGSSTEQWNYRFSTALMIDKKPTKSGFDLDTDDDTLLQVFDPTGRISPNK
jgi:hypothetical protein